MKKTLSIVLVLLMMILPLASYAEAVEEPAEAPEVEQIVLEYDYNHLVVGNTTPFNGRFFTTMWGGPTSDLDVQRLIHGYNLVKWQTAEGGGYNIDPTVVSGIVVTEDAVTGDRTYTFDLYHDLYYSDGTQITAWDYAFSWLLSMAPQMAELGGNIRPMEYLEGYQGYVNGNVPYLAGIRVLTDYTIAITIDSAYLPFFYEMALLDCYPYPISVIAPGSSVRDDGNGIYIAPAMNTETLRQTILNEATGYRSHPSVTSGPYVLTDYDGEKAEFVINPYYKGTEDGVRPTIANLTYKTVKNEDMLEQFKTGEVGLLNKVVNAEVLGEAVRLVGEQELFMMSNYARSGLSYIALCTERAGMNSQAVRQALSMCMDKDAFVSATVGDFGLRADGYYGIGQWMYTLVNAADGYPVEAPAEGAPAAEQREYEEELAKWAELSMDGIRVYEFDPQAAAALLESDGWKLGADGIREKQGQKLSLKLLCPTESKVAETLNATFGANLAQIGVKLTIEELPMDEMLKSFYRTEARDCDMMYIASNFGIVFDPTNTFRADGTGVNMSNFSAINDPQLYGLAVSMRETEPGDLLTYCQKWVAFEERFQEIVPAIPLYSGVYFDFYPNVLQNYDINNNATWGEAVAEAYMADYVPEEAAEGEEVFGD